MAQFVYRFPDARTGLSRWDEVLLQQTIENGPLLLRVFGHTWATADTPDYVGESYLFDRITKLGAADLRSPLISLSRNQSSENRPQIELTDIGRKVLAGDANHVKENGIDDWVGGVHFTPDTVVFRDGDRLLLS